MRIRFAGKTDVGRQRDHNEDAILIVDSFRVILVADGLGGHQSGQVASALCVSTVSDFFTVSVDADATWPFPYNEQLTEEENFLFTGLRLANRRIYDRSKRNTDESGMATTCVGAMFSRNARRVSVANVGDSRCYRIRAGTIKQLTRDHSLVSDALHAAPWMSQAEVALLPPNVITRALGIREDVVVDLHNEPTEVGDVYLVCSDGLTGPVSPEEMLEIVGTRTDVDAVAEDLIAKANEYGGPDNISAAIALVEEHGPITEAVPRPRASETGHEPTDPGGIPPVRP
jgi:serine/threonine protein phosphatase PrpC